MGHYFLSNPRIMEVNASLSTAHAGLLYSLLKGFTSAKRKM